MFKHSLLWYNNDKMVITTFQGGKKMKKILTSLLVFVMVVSVTTSAYAEDEVVRVENEYLTQIADEFFNWGFGILSNVGTIGEMPDYNLHVSARPYNLKDNTSEYGKFSCALMTTACQIGQVVRYRNDNPEGDTELGMELYQEALRGLMDIRERYTTEDIEVVYIPLKDTGDPYITFENKKDTTDVFGTEFKATLVNHHPYLTFDGFCEVILYDSSGNPIDSIAMVASETSPHGRSLIKSLPSRVDFNQVEKYEIRVSVPNWY